jgi:hypothetical protein
MVRVKAVTQPRDTGSDLVECNTLLAPIWYALVHACRDVSLIQFSCCPGGKLICCAPMASGLLNEVPMCIEETYRACRRTSSPCAGEVSPGSEGVLVWRGGLVRDGGAVCVMKTKACLR